jgi:hypothetical protein
MEIGPDPRLGARTIKDSLLYPAARDRLYGMLPIKQTPPSPIPSISQPGPSNPRKKEAKPLPSMDFKSQPRSSMDLSAWSSSPPDVIEISDDEEPGIRPLVVFAWVKVSFHTISYFEAEWESRMNAAILKLSLFPTVMTTALPLMNSNWTLDAMALNALVILKFSALGWGNGFPFTGRTSLVLFNRPLWLTSSVTRVLRSSIDLVTSWAWLMEEELQVIIY